MVAVAMRRGERPGSRSPRLGAPGVSTEKRRRGQVPWRKGRRCRRDEGRGQRIRVDAWEAVHELRAAGRAGVEQARESRVPGQGAECALAPGDVAGSRRGLGQSLPPVRPFYLEEERPAVSKVGCSWCWWRRTCGSGSPGSFRKAGSLTSRAETAIPWVKGGEGRGAGPRNPQLSPDTTGNSHAVGSSSPVCEPCPRPESPWRGRAVRGLG